MYTQHQRCNWGVGATGWHPEKRLISYESNRGSPLVVNMPLGLSQGKENSSSLKGDIPERSLFYLTS